MTVRQRMRTIDEIPDVSLDSALTFPLEKSIGKILAIMELLKNHYKGDNKKSEFLQESLHFD